MLDEPVIFEEDGLFGLKSSDGTILISPHYGEICGFSDGYSMVYDTDGYAGLIDTQGNEIVPTIYDSITIPAEGYFVVGKEETDDAGNYDIYYEFMHESGESTGWVFDYAENFRERYARVSNGNDEYLLDLDGYLHSIVPYRFSYGEGFCEGRLMISLDGLYGYLDATLQVCTPCQYISITDFEDGIALVQHEDGHYSYINRDGEIIEDNVHYTKPFEWDREKASAFSSSSVTSSYQHDHI